MQCKIKVGDTVRTIKDVDMGGNDLYPVGTVGKVTFIDEDCTLKYKVNDYYWYSRDMLELVDDKSQEREN